MAEVRRPVLLIQFAKQALPGQVKTRMMPHLSADEACDLHSELVCWTSQRLLDAQLGDVQLSVAGDLQAPLFQQCRTLGVHTVTRQRGADLGQKMFQAIASGLQTHEKVLLVGSDCPALDKTYLSQALLGLDQAPLVFGPAVDGGYVLVGARSVQPELFQGIRWGSSRVYAQTVAVMQDRGLHWHELEALEDVDRPEDLPGWWQIKAQALSQAH